MMKCPFCHKETDEQMNVCPNCKAAIPHAEKKEEEPLRVINKRNKKESE